MELMLIAEIRKLALVIGAFRGSHEQAVTWKRAAGHEFHWMIPNATAKLPRGGFWGDLFSFLGLRSGDANKFPDGREFPSYNVV